MRKVSLDNIELGMKLGKTIYNEQGNVLLSEGIEINESYARKLKRIGITDIYIEDGISEGVEVEDVISEETRRTSRAILRDIVKDVSVKDSVKRDKVREVAKKIVSELFGNKNILVNMMDIKSVDGYTYQHSVNVCVLAVIMGMGLEYNMNRMEELAIGALLHDIGKIRVPPEILNKPAQLTDEEYELIKKHTVYGHEILKKAGTFSSISTFIALAHHERFDGTGYPLKLKGEKTHQCARIVQVADVYDALTSDRVYRPKMKTYKAVEYLYSLSTHQFDPDIVKCFMKYVAIYPAGTGVVLNSRQKGLVVKAGKMPDRPIVRIIYNEKGEKLKTFYEIDLMNKLNLFIVDTCEL